MKDIIAALIETYFEHREKFYEETYNCNYEFEVTQDLEKAEIHDRTASLHAKEMEEAESNLRAMMGYSIRTVAENSKNGHDACYQFDFFVERVHVAHAKVWSMSLHKDGPWIEEVVIAPFWRRIGLSKWILNRIEGQFLGQTIRTQAKSYSGCPLTTEEIEEFLLRQGYAAYDKHGRVFKHIPI